MNVTAVAARKVNPDTGEVEDLPPPPDPIGGLPPVTAQAAIVIERTTARVIGSKNPDSRRAPARTTKIMTALLAVEAVRSAEVARSNIVTLGADVKVEGAGKLGLSAGDRISLRDLLYMTLLESDNDAATAVGTHVAGSRSSFIGRMNIRAAQLGMDSTSYVGISGRDPESWIDGCSGNDFENWRCAHYTTARDLAALAKVALADIGFSRIVGTPTWTTTTWRRPAPGQPSAVLDLGLTTTNRLVDSTSSDFFAPAYGVKTGTTDRAGANLVSSARRGAKDVIAVVLGAAADDTTSGDRWSDSRAVLNFGLDS